MTSFTTKNLIITLIIASLFIAQASCETLHWKAGVSATWSLSVLNWLKIGTGGGLIPAGILPKAGDDIVIDGSGSYTVTFDLGSLITFKSVVVGKAGATGKQTLKITKDFATSSALTIESTGECVVSSAVTISGEVAVKAGGTIKAEGSGLKKFSGKVVNNGRMELQGGVTEVQSTYTQEDPSSVLACTSGNLTVSASGDGELKIKNGTLKGTGSVKAKLVTNSGKTEPGNSPGNFFINGDFHAPINSIMVLEIDANTNDRLHVSGKATVEGLVVFKSVDGYSHSIGRKATFLVYSSHNYKPFSTFFVGDGFLNKKPTVTVGSVSCTMETQKFLGSGASKIRLMSVTASLLLLLFGTYLAFS